MRNRLGEAIRGTAVVASSASVLTQACAAYDVFEEFATITEELRLALSWTIRVWLMVSAAYALGMLALSSSRQLLRVISERGKGCMVFDRA
jgi:hypothetical protein